MLWFTKTLNETTTEDIQLRLCMCVNEPLDINTIVTSLTVVVTANIGRNLNNTTIITGTFIIG